MATYGGVSTHRALRDDETEPYLTTREAAEYLSLSEFAVRRHVGAGRLAALRVGTSARGQLRFRRADLDGLLTSTTSLGLGESTTT